MVDVDKIALAHWLTQAMEFWERHFDDLKHKVLTQPAFALDDGGGILGPATMDAAVLAWLKAQCLRRWVSELHVTEAEVKAYGKAYKEAQEVKLP